METWKQMINSFVNHCLDCLFLMGLLLVNLGGVHVCVLRLGTKNRFFHQKETKLHSRSSLRNIKPESNDSTAIIKNCVKKVNYMASFTKIDAIVLYQTIKSIATGKQFDIHVLFKTIKLLATDSIVDHYVLYKVINSTYKDVEADRLILFKTKKNESIDIAIDILSPNKTCASKEMKEYSGTNCFPQNKTSKSKPDISVLSQMSDDITSSTKNCIEKVNYKASFTRIDANILYQTIIKLIATCKQFKTTNLLGTNSIVDNYVLYKVINSTHKDAESDRRVLFQSKKYESIGIETDVNTLFPNKTSTSKDNKEYTRNIVSNPNKRGSSKDIEEYTRTNVLPQSMTSTSKDIEEYTRTNVLPLSKTRTSKDIDEYTRTNDLPLSKTSTSKNLEEYTRTNVLPLSNTSSSKDIEEYTRINVLPQSKTSTSKDTEEYIRTNVLPLSNTSSSKDIEEYTRTNGLPLRNTSTSKDIEEYTRTNVLPLSNTSTSKDIEEYTRTNVLPLNKTSELKDIKTYMNVLPQIKKFRTKDKNGETDIIVLPQNETSKFKDNKANTNVFSISQKSKSNDDKADVNILIKTQKKKAKDTTANKDISEAKDTNKDIISKPKKLEAINIKVTTDILSKTKTSKSKAHKVKTSKNVSSRNKISVATDKTDSNEVTLVSMRRSYAYPETDSSVISEAGINQSTDTRDVSNEWTVVSTRRKGKVAQLFNDVSSEIKISENTDTQLDSYFWPDLFGHSVTDTEVHNTVSETTMSSAEAVKKRTMLKKRTTSTPRWTMVGPAYFNPTYPEPDEADCMSSTAVCPEMQPLTWGTSIVSSRYVRSNRHMLHSLIRSANRYKQWCHIREPKHKKIDFHKKTVSEAVDSFYRFYNRQLQYYKENGYRDRDKYIYVITGHCKNRPDKTAKIRPEIESILHEEQVSHLWFNNGGEVIVELDSGGQSDHCWYRKEFYCNCKEDGQM